MRIENEIKLRVPRERQDAVWAYLTACYGSSSTFLMRLDTHLHAKFAEDRFVDQYFDNPQFQLVSMQSGVRHRARAVLTDSSNRKNGRELMQIKVNHIDGNQLNRGEYKYPIHYYKPGGKEAEHDYHPFLGLVKRKHRTAVIAQLMGIGVDALELEPTILITQLRKRVYIYQDTSAFATITLDIDSSFYMGDTVLFTELEMELNEIAYTEADSATRQRMEEMNNRFRQDLLLHFPEIQQDQTPKYNKAAAKFGIDPANGKFGKQKFPWRTMFLSLIPLSLIGGIWALYRKRIRDLENEKRRFFARAGNREGEGGTAAS